MVGFGPKARAGVISATSKHPVNSFKAHCALAARQAYTGPPLDCALSVQLDFVLPRPQRLRWKSRPMPSEPHTSKPDAENLAKSVLDALSQIVWVDDSRIYELVARKRVAAGDEAPHVRVTVRIVSEL